jgi:hypothetical protein
LSLLKPDVQKLISDCIDSVEAVEILLLLRRSPDAYWTSDAVSQQLGMQSQLASAKLRGLAENRLLVVGGDTGAYRYAPRDAETRQAVDNLAAAYANLRIHVINTIYSANLERLRAFSDAFRLKKE